MIGIERIDARAFRKALAMLQAIEPDSKKILSKDLKSQLQPMANQIASSVPSQPPLSGFGNQGRTRWSRVKGKTSFTSGRSRANATNLVAIRIEPGSTAGAGPIIAELAGSRSQGKTASGEAMINKLNELKPMKGRGGRYAYNQFRLLRPDIVRIATDIINGTFKRFEGMLK